MDDRSELAVRAEVLNKLADQLSEQLAVERRANEELRALLRDGPTVSLPRDRGPGLAPLVTTLAGVAVAVTLCIGVAASWGHREVCPAACPARFAAVTAAMAPVVAPANLVGLRPLGPPEPPPAARPYEPTTLVPLDNVANPRDCGPLVNVTAARCFLQATGGNGSGEYMLRNLILAHTLLGERTRARALALRYYDEFGDSPFARQIRMLGYEPAP